MLARSPQEICSLFQRYMAEGNLESVLDLYDPEAVFIKEMGEVTDGREALKAELAPARGGDEAGTRDRGRPPGP
jgi:hypothetical protein